MFYVLEWNVLRHEKKKKKGKGFQKTRLTDTWCESNIKTVVVDKPSELIT